MTQEPEVVAQILPPNLIAPAPEGPYYYRAPRTGRVKNLGNDREAAIAYAIATNQTNLGKDRDWKPKRVVRLAAYTENPDLLSEDQIRDIARPIAKLSGVYILLHGGRVVYVGQSTNCHARIGAHFTEREKKFDSFHIIECRGKELDRIEAQYIGKFMPKYNVLIPKVLGPVFASDEAAA